MSNFSPKQQGSGRGSRAIQSILSRPLKQDLEALSEIPPTHQMTEIHSRLQPQVSEDAPQKGEIQTMAMIASFVKAGATLRWGPQGWEIRQGEIPVQSDTIDQICRLEYIQGDANVNALDADRQPNELVKHLLSSEYAEKLDDVSRHALRATQNRAYFEYLDGLAELYQEHSRLYGGAINYCSLAREKFHFWRQFVWLYLAGILHLFGVLESFRMRLAQRSLDAISLLIG
jgi:hypothetical protein